MLALRRVLQDPGRCQDVILHRLILCEYALSMPTEDLFHACRCCDRFLAFCCSCYSRQAQAARRRGLLSPEPPAKLCHYYKMVYVDGACLNNGRDGATAGIGIAVGVDQETMHWALPVDDDMDPSSIRTSQRAELLAAIYGIRKLAEFEENVKNQADIAREVHADSEDKITWVITSDSEYVVMGMTEWVPGWKENGWRNGAGKRPKNLDLFQSLGMAVERYERDCGVRIAFWHISRIHNELADWLAKSAAKGDTIEPVQLDSESMYSLSDEMATD